MTGLPLVAAFCGALLFCAQSTLAAPLALTKADGTSFDTVGEGYGFANGYVLSWQRNRIDGSLVSTIRARKFSTAGAALGKELLFDQQAMQLSEPVVMPASNGRLAALWLRPTTGVVGRIGNPATGAVGTERLPLPAAADRPAEVNLDAVPLTSGKYLLLTYRFDFTTGTHKRVAATVLGADLSPVAGPTMVPGVKASYVATAASDFTAAGTGDGGALIVYRNRADGNLYAVKMAASGALGANAVRVNTLAMPLGSGGQQANFEVDAARLADGRIVVAWTRLGSTDSDNAFDVDYRILAAGGQPVGTERRAHPSTAEEQLAPEVAALPGGGFEIAWTNNGGPVDGRPRSYFLRRFKADGTPFAAARLLSKGDRATNSQLTELVSTGSKLLLVHGKGSVPLTLEGFPALP